MTQPTLAPAPHQGFHLHALSDAHTALNRAWTASAPSEGSGSLRADDALSFTRDAHVRLQEALAYEGPDDALAAAHAVLPRVTRATELIAALGSDLNQAHIDEIVAEYAAAMDRLEATLDAAGWD